MVVVEKLVAVASEATYAHAGSLMRRRVATGFMTAAASAAATSLTPATEKDQKREYLIWERGFGARMSAALGSLVLLSLCASYSTEVWVRGMALQSEFTFVLQRLAQRLEWWSLLGLLSSSCCVVQLGLNAFSFGCAGFNTLLGPVRPYFVALTIFLQAAAWRAVRARPSNAREGRAARQAGPVSPPHAAHPSSRALFPRAPQAMTRATYRTAMLGSVVAVSLTLLPEALHLWLHRHQLRTRFAALVARPPSAEEGAAAPAQGVDAAQDCPGDASSTELTLSVRGMGCTACTVKAQGALEALPGVLGCVVGLSDASATLSLAPVPPGYDQDGGVAGAAVSADGGAGAAEAARRARQLARERVTREAIAALDAAGFEASLSGQSSGADGP